MGIVTLKNNAQEEEIAVKSVLSDLNALLEKIESGNFQCTQALIDLKKLCDNETAETIDSYPILESFSLLKLDQSKNPVINQTVKNVILSAITGKGLDAEIDTENVYKTISVHKRKPFGWPSFK